MKWDNLISFFLGALLIGVVCMTGVAQENRDTINRGWTTYEGRIFVIRPAKAVEVAE